METVAGLDIGSSRIVAAVAVSDPGPPAGETYISAGQGNSRPEWSDPAAGSIITESAQTAGLRKGQVYDPAALAGSVREALSRAESSSGMKIDAVCVGFSGHSVEFYRNRYGNLVGKRRINIQDLDRINRLSMVSDLPPGRMIIRALPLEYYVDGTPVTGDPVGMFCHRLEVESLIITADNYVVEQTLESVREAGFRVIDIFPAPLAAGEVLLKRAQQHLGTALADIGGSCTCVIVYNHGYPTHFEVLPVGSDHITSDLAICLRTTLEGAEEIKKKIGLGPGRDDPDAGIQTVAVPRMSGSGYNEISVGNVSEIVEARASEILELIESSVKRLTGGIDLPGGLVLAGGGSRLKGLGLLAADHLGIKIQPGYTGNEGDAACGPDIAGSVGLLKYCSVKTREAEAGDRPAPGVWKRLRSIFKVLK